MREKIFLLLDATQTSVGGASGKFPQYYNAYCDLVVRIQPLLITTVTSSVIPSDILGTTSEN